MHTLPLVLILLLSAMLFLFPQITLDGTKQGLQVCAVSILPMLFPFFVITNLWCSLGYSERLGKFTSPIMQKLFHLSGNGASTFFLGLIGGYPAGAQAVAQQYKQGQITKPEAEHLILFCNNAGPAFILGIAGRMLFRSTLIGFILYFIHAVSAILIGILFRPQQSESNAQPVSCRRVSFSSAMTSSVRQAGNTAIQVCVFVVFFSVLTGYLRAFLPQTWCASIPGKFILGSVELASGALILQDTENKAVCLCLMSFLLGWGGLCVAFQTMSILDDTDLSQRKYLLCKLLHGLFSLLLAAVAVLLLPISGREAVYSIISKTPQLSAAALILLLPLCLFLKKTSGNTLRNQL